MWALQSPTVLGSCAKNIWNNSLAIFLPLHTSMNFNPLLDYPEDWCHSLVKRRPQSNKKGEFSLWILGEDYSWPVFQAPKSSKSCLITSNNATLCSSLAFALQRPHLSFSDGGQNCIQWDLHPLMRISPYFSVGFQTSELASLVKGIWKPPTA